MPQNEEEFFAKRPESDGSYTKKTRYVGLALQKKNGRIAHFAG